MRREFSTKVKVAAFERSNGHCEKCGCWLTVGKFHYDHVIPCALGGEPTLDNAEVLCTPCHAVKTHGKRTGDVTRIAKAKRQQAKHIGAKTTRNPMPGSRASRWKRKMNGEVVER